MLANGDRIRLERHHLVLPRGARGARRRSERVSVAYRDIAALAIVEPFEGEPRRFIVRMVDGTTLVLPFPRRSTLEMRRVRHQAWKRVRAARRGPGPGSAGEREGQAVGES